jgi:phosphotriesterase-related protein
VTASSVATVNGPVAAAELAPLLYHEHVTLDNRSTPSLAAYWLPGAEVMTAELRTLATAGGRSVVSLTNQCMGRDLAVMRDVSRAAGVNVIAATGLYTRTASPPIADVTALAATFTDELRTGVAAVIGEIGTGDWPIGDFERELFRASAMAHVETGAPIATHTHAGMHARWQLDTLTRYGAPADRVVLGHVDEGIVFGPAYIDRLAALADRGAYLGFDTVGITYYSAFMKRQQPSDEMRASAIRRLVDLGYGDRILISHDICRPDHLKANGGWGFAHIFDVFMPLLAAQGLSDAAARKLVDANPIRWLTGA